MSFSEENQAKETGQASECFFVVGSQHSQIRVPGDYFKLEKYISNSSGGGRGAAATSHHNTTRATLLAPIKYINISKSICQYCRYIDR